MIEPPDEDDAVRVCPENLDALTALWLDIGLKSLRQQLATDADFTDREREALIARATPLLRDHYRAHFMRLCAPAARVQ